MDKVAIFIDGGYLEKILKNEFGQPRIDFGKLSQRMAEKTSAGSEIIRTYYYNCPPYQGNPPSREESERYGRKAAFFDGLRRIPRYEVRLGTLSRRGPDSKGQYNYEQKMVDVLLSIDLVRLSSKSRISNAAILAGDGDFAPAFRAAKEEAVVVTLFHGEHRHRQLWEAADERIRIDQPFIDSILL